MSFFELAGFRDDNHVFGRPSDFVAREWQDGLGQVVVDKMSKHETGTMVCSFEVGVGGGKTTGAAWAASYILNAKMAERVVYVAPNRMILLDAIATFRRFGIHLVDWENGKFPHGEPSLMHGPVYTAPDDAEAETVGFRGAMSSDEAPRRAFGEGILPPDEMEER